MTLKNFLEVAKKNHFEYILKHRVVSPDVITK